jgi:hypothetical protein
MIKISANISKKVPIPGTDFSSQQFGAAMEVEVSNADTPENIHARVRELYQTLSVAIDEQIGAATQSMPVNSPPVPAPVANRQYPPPLPQPTVNTGRASYSPGRGNGRPNGNGGNGKRTSATEAQQRAIYAICKAANLDMNAVLADFNVTDASQLSVKDASRLIDELKTRQNDPAQQPRR